MDYSFLEQIFGKKAVKRRKKELLEEIRNLLIDITDQTELDESNTQYYIKKSYENYHDLLKGNPKLKEFFHNDYHVIYIHAYYMSTYYFEEGTCLEQVSKQINRYHKEYDKLLEGKINKEHYDQLITLAFLNAKIDELGIQKKKKKTLKEEEAKLIQKREKQKVLIY